MEHSKLIRCQFQLRWKSPAASRALTDIWDITILAFHKIIKLSHYIYSRKTLDESYDDLILFELSIVSFVIREVDIFEWAYIPWDSTE